MVEPTSGFGAAPAADSSNLAQFWGGSVVELGCWLSHGDAVSMATGNVEFSGHSSRGKVGHIKSG